jgi:molecular chaperone DnaK (HSP70)
MEKVIAEKDAVFLDEGKQLPLPPNLPQGTPVDIRFEVDKQGILHVTASAASESIDFELKLKGIMTDEEFKRAKEDLEASQSV